MTSGEDERHTEKMAMITEAMAETTAFNPEAMAEMMFPMLYEL